MRFAVFSKENPKTKNVLHRISVTGMAFVMVAEEKMVYIGLKERNIVHIVPLD